MNSLDEISHLADIPLEMEMELDRVMLSVGFLLELDKGSTVRLGRSAGENIDISVGGALVGFGEIVVIEDTMGVRITDFLSHE